MSLKIWTHLHSRHFIFEGLLNSCQDFGECLLEKVKVKPFFVDILISSINTNTDLRIKNHTDCVLYAVHMVLTLMY